MDGRTEVQTNESELRHLCPRLPPSWSGLRSWDDTDDSDNRFVKSSTHLHSVHFHAATSVPSSFMPVVLSSICLITSLLFTILSLHILFSCLFCKSRNKTERKSICFKGNLEIITKEETWEESKDFSAEKWAHFPDYLAQVVFFYKLVILKSETMIRSAYKQNWSQEKLFIPS